MRLNCNGLKQRSFRVSKSAGQTQRALPLLALIFLFSLTTLACAFLGGSRSASTYTIHRLPTLTRTPLPTLTPTGLAMPAASAPSAENAAPAVVPLAAPDSPQAAGQVAETNVAVAVNPSAQNSVVAPAEPVPADAGAPPANQPAAEALPPTATATAVPLPTDTPTSTPLPTDTPTPTVTPTPQIWVFNGVRLSPNPYNDGLLMYGNVVNNTGAAQKVKAVLGTFYDAQNQVIAGPDSGEGYSPAYVVAPGGGVPFELAVETIDNAANFDLNVAAEPSDELPRQDFEFSDIEQWADEGLYCINGELKNHGGELHDYLVIALILYDSQENVVSFSYYEELDPDWIEGDEELDFELCSDVLEQGVARHELQAWGR